MPVNWSATSSPWFVSRARSQRHAQLHKLTPPLAGCRARLQGGAGDDGRMSGASGKVPAAIHVSPSAGRRTAGPRARRRPDPARRRRRYAAALVGDAEWAAREPASVPADEAEAHAHGLGRELFAAMRRNVKSASKRDQLDVNAMMNTLELAAHGR